MPMEYEIYRSRLLRAFPNADEFMIRDAWRKQLTAIENFSNATVSALENRIGVIIKTDAEEIVLAVSVNMVPEMVEWWAKENKDLTSPVFTEWWITRRWLLWSMLSRSYLYATYRPLVAAALSFACAEPHGDNETMYRALVVPGTLTLTITDHDLPAIMGDHYIFNLDWQPVEVR